MPFELKSIQNDNVVFSGNFTTQDYESGVFDDGRIDGFYHIPLQGGNLRTWQWFVKGIRLMYSEYELNDYTELEWKGDLELITMYFNLKGRFSLSAAGSATTVELGNNQHNIFYGKEASGVMKMEALTMKSFMIQFTRDAFFNISSEGNDALKRFADNVNNGKVVWFSNSNLNIDLDIQKCINAILNCPYADGLKRMFYYSKAIELVVLQAESFDKLLSHKPRHLKSDYDKERIIFARDYIIERLEAPPSLSELSKIAGINEYKLKRGFKEVFGTTVFGYLNEIKMERAKSDLLGKKKSATEIAFDLGFSSVQHFSAAFKKKFGVPPNQV